MHLPNQRLIVEVLNQRIVVKLRPDSAVSRSHSRSQLTQRFSIEAAL